MHGMTSYFIRRLLLVPVTFLFITFMIYGVLRLAPGGPIEQARVAMMKAQSGEGGGGGGGSDSGGTGMTEEQMRSLMEYYQLDKPIPVGYLVWLGLWPNSNRGDSLSGVIQADFGDSTRYGKPVLPTITSKFRVSIYFGLIGYLASWVVCIPLGIFKALKHRTTFDTVTSVVV